MDMAPPQAPPAHVAHENEAAVATLRRLAQWQAWLDTQVEALPSPDPGDVTGGAEARGRYLGQLDNAWAQVVPLPGGHESLPRVEALAEALAGVMAGDASLRAADGTLPTTAAEAIRRFTRGDGDIQARTITFGDVAYAGAVAIPVPGSDAMVAFWPDQGWEVHASLDAMHTAVERRLRRSLLLDPNLPGQTLEDATIAATRGGISSMPLAGATFTVLAERIIAVQRHKLEDAWDDLAVGLETQDAFQDATRAALDLHGYLNVHRMMEHRDALLAERLNDARLAAEPVAVATAWRRAYLDYRDALLDAARIAHEHGITPLPSLEAFTLQRMNHTLAQAGFAIDAAGVQVDVRALPTAPAAWVAQWGAGHVVRMSLASFALRNAGRLELLSVTPVAQGDSTAVGEPTGADLIRAVRAADVAGGYVDMIDQRLGDTVQALAAQRMATGVLAARMRFEAEDARVGRHPDHAGSGLRFDHAERGYQWIDAVLDAPVAGSRRRVEGHQVVASQLTYRGAVMSDVLVLSTSQPQAVPTVVLYTPDAPDGISYREFPDRATAAEAFLLAPAFQDYLASRLPVEFSEPTASGERRLNARPSTQTAVWSLGGPRAPGQARQDEWFAERRVDDDIMDASYRVSVQLLRRNAEYAGRRSSAADHASAMAWFRQLVVAPGAGQQFVAQTITATAESIPRVFQAAWRMYDAVKAGDHPQAFMEFTSGYLSALNVLGLGSARPAQLAGAWVRAASGRGAVASRITIRDTAARFDARYKVPVELPGGAVGADGIYRANGRTYITQKGNVYGVRFDPAIDGWRLARASAPDSQFTGPAIMRAADGSWRHRPVGLLGGSGRGDIPLSISQLTHRAARLSREVQDLTPSQWRALWDDLRRRCGSAIVAGDILRRAVRAASPQGGPAGTLSRHEIQLWRSSVGAARAIRPTARARTGAVDLSARPPDGLEQLLPDQWPEFVWHYTSRNEVRLMGGPIAFLHQSRLPDGQVFGLSALTAPPMTPWQAATGLLPPVQGAPNRAIGEVAGAWVRINLGALRERANLEGNVALNVFRPAAPGSTRIVVRLAPTRTDPLGQAPILLRNDQYTVGTWDIARP